VPVMCCAPQPVLLGRAGGRGVDQQCVAVVWLLAAEVLATGEGIWREDYELVVIRLFPGCGPRIDPGRPGGAAAGPRRHAAAAGPATVLPRLCGIDGLVGCDGDAAEGAGIDLGLVYA